MSWPLTGARVVVAGAGGVARAVVYACGHAGVAHLTLGNRTVPRRSAVSTRSPLDSDEFEPAVRGGRPGRQRHDRGHDRPGHDAPRRRAAARRDGLRLRLRPCETPLLAAARARGLRAANGSEMLIAQAAIAFERWTGVSGMADVMREAVAPLLADPRRAA